MKKRLNLNTIGVKSKAKSFGCFNHIVTFSASQAERIPFTLRTFACED
jgi:hypothetical protein